MHGTGNYLEDKEVRQQSTARLQIHGWMYQHSFADLDGGRNVALLMAADRPDKVKKAAALAAISNASGYYPYVITAPSQLSHEMSEKQYQGG